MLLSGVAHTASPGRPGSLALPGLQHQLMTGLTPGKRPGCQQNQVLRAAKAQDGPSYDTKTQPVRMSQVSKRWEGLPKLHAAAPAADTTAKPAVQPSNGKTRAPAQNGKSWQLLPGVYAHRFS